MTGKEKLSLYAGAFRIYHLNVSITPSAEMPLFAFKITSSVIFPILAAKR
jgi:hypothetical protein